MQKHNSCVQYSDGVQAFDDLLAVNHIGPSDNTGWLTAAVPFCR